MVLIFRCINTTFSQFCKLNFQAYFLLIVNSPWAADGIFDANQRPIMHSTELCALFGFTTHNVEVDIAEI